MTTDTDSSRGEAQPVAWRYRYLYTDGRPLHWIVRQSPITSSPPTPGYVGVEAEPLYTTAPSPIPQSEAGERIALEGYRAAAAYIGADSWDGCSDCMEILRAARATDVLHPVWEPDDVANALRDLRCRMWGEARGPSTPTAQTEGSGLAEELAAVGSLTANGGRAYSFDDAQRLIDLLPRILTALGRAEA